MYVCNDKCSHNVDVAKLRAFGYDVPVLRHDATAMDKARHERLVAGFVHDAGARGLVRLCTRHKRVK